MNVIPKLKPRTLDVEALAKINDGVTTYSARRLLNSITPKKTPYKYLEPRQRNIIEAARALVEATGQLGHFKPVIKKVSTGFAKREVVADYELTPYGAYMLLTQCNPLRGNIQVKQAFFKQLAAKVNPTVKKIDRATKINLLLQASPETPEKQFAVAVTPEVLLAEMVSNLTDYYSEIWTANRNFTLSQVWNMISDKLKTWEGFDLDSRIKRARLMFELSHTKWRNNGRKGKQPVLASPISILKENEMLPETIELCKELLLEVSDN